ncbi:MAG: PilN domain-containing protein [Candidatus Aceula meridiana]|nr:PilN domain-containing protein [Candidatus Aceula meridiana]
MLKKATGSIIAHLTEQTLKLALIKPFQKNAQVSRLAIIDIKGLSDQDITSKVKTSLSEFGVVKAETVCALSPNATTTKNIEIPSVDPHEIKSIIDLQAGRHTPFSREEIIIGYINFGIYQKNYSKILLVIVNCNVIFRQIKILQDTGLSVHHVLFTPETKVGFYTSIFGAALDDAPVGIINIGKEYTDFTVMLHGTAIACRSIPVGLAQITEDKETAEKKLGDELKQSIDSYQNEDIEQLPKEYILFDVGEDIKGLEFIIAEQLKVPVKTVSYVDRLNFSPEAKKIIEQNKDESFFDVISPGFLKEPGKIDFIPEEISMQRSIEEQGREGIKLGALAIIFLIIIGVIFMSKVYFKNTLLEKIKSEYRATERQARELERTSTKTRIVKSYLNSRLVPLEALRELYFIIPDEIYLKSFIIDEKGRITIDGTSDSMSQVFALVGTLENSELFKGVKTKSTTAKKERGKDVASFEIVFRLESAQDENEDEEVEAVETEAVVGDAAAGG